MAKLVWDAVGTRTYETGVDKGVLYLSSGLGVAWNGIVSCVKDTSEEESESIYLDGLKVRDVASMGSYALTLNAYSFPEEFLDYQGYYNIQPGLYVDDQPSKFFALSYVTKIGNDTVGLDLGYKIHLMYQLIASNDNNKFETITDINSPVIFSWKMDTIPIPFPGYKPTSHIALDSRRISAFKLQTVEDTLYGTSTVAPRLPSMDEIYQYLKL